MEAGMDRPFGEGLLFAPWFLMVWARGVQALNTAAPQTGIRAGLLAPLSSCYWARNIIIIQTCLAC